MIQRHTGDSQNQLLPRSTAHWLYLLIFFCPFTRLCFPQALPASLLSAPLANSLHHCFALLFLVPRLLSGTAISAFCIVTLTKTALPKSSGGYPLPKLQNKFSPHSLLSLALFLFSLQAPSRFLLSCSSRVLLKFPSKG